MMKMIQEAADANSPPVSPAKTVDLAEMDSSTVAQTAPYYDPPSPPPAPVPEEVQSSSRRPPGVPEEAIDVCGEGGLHKIVLTAGDADGECPEPGSQVQVHYVGTFMDGSKFDSSRDRAGNFSFTIGQGEVIKGWDEGVATMRKGEVAVLFCRHDYAYGELGSPPKIPARATLRFEVELLSWGPRPRDRWEVGASEKLEMAEALKADGTAAFKVGEWQEAARLYAEAVGWVEYEHEFTEEQAKREATALLASCSLNEAMCSLKLEDWSRCIVACGKVLEVDSQNVKALFRRGSAFIGSGGFEEARRDLKEAARLDPKSKEVRQAYASIKAAEAEAREAAKAVYAKMMR